MNYAALAPYYDNSNPPVWQAVRDLLSGVPAGSVVLDIGCGTGRVRQALPGDITYTGIDNSPELIAIAERQYPQDKFLIGDARALPFRDNTFDAVLLIAVIHHFMSRSERLTVLQEARRVLKSGGRLYLTVWNLSRPKFWKLWRGWRRVVVPNRHDKAIKRTYYAYSRNILQRELAQVGFTIEFVESGNNLVARAHKK